jgi:hypothetical protein
MNDTFASKSKDKRRYGGFVTASSLVGQRVRIATEKKGFAVSKVLTNWPEVVGEETARITRPVDVKFSKDGFGATLTLLVAGAYAPMLQADLPKIREKVNACYGYNAISRIKITQTSATGFSEGQAQFTAIPKQVTVDPAIIQTSQAIAVGVQSDGLRDALEALGQNVLSRAKR